jgi:hypothetical protein
MYDKYCLSIRKKVEFFSDVISRIDWYERVGILSEVERYYK